MKILQINKYLYPKGGAETYLLALADLLRQEGHKICFFSQKNPKNIKNDQEQYFINELKLDRFHWLLPLRLGRIFWSFAAARKIKKIIANEKPDLAHIHNIYHQISPSILPTLKKNNIPIVLTVHDFKLIKHDYTLRADNKKFRAKNSLIIDWLLKLEFWWHQKLNSYDQYIDYYIAPSKFVRNQLINAGFGGLKIKVLPHFTISKSKLNSATPIDSNYILYFGRLDESKGVDLLIKAFSQINYKNINLKIAGQGPQKTELINLIKQLDLEHKIQFVGQKNNEQLKKLIKNSLFSVVPTRVKETFGLSVLESFNYGRAVIATKVGALPELVKHGENGLLFEVNNQKELAENIDYLLANKEILSKMGKMAKKLSQNYSAENHCQKLIEIYQQVIKK